MKILLGLLMIMSSAFAMADEHGWDVKCYDRMNHEMDLAYIIKVDHHDMEEAKNRYLTLLDCKDDDKHECHKRGPLYQDERQNEKCLVLKRWEPSLTNGSWSLCYEEQETLVNRLVPVTITDDHQESRAYCERSLLRIL